MTMCKFNQILCTMPCRLRSFHSFVCLLQIYAPDTEEETAFHRTIFLTCCVSATCHGENDSSCFHVFRCQLPRRNRFYSFYPPDEEHPVSEEQSPDGCPDLAPLCWVCGFRGEKTCSKCHNARYCSKEHQIVHWKNGHKEQCLSSPCEGSKMKQVDQQGVVVSYLFPEFELVTETEPEELEEQKTEEQRIEEYEEFVKEKGSGVAEAVDVEEFEASLSEIGSRHVDYDKVFHQFKNRISREPEQVLRYQRHGEPLWVSNKVPGVNDIPPCNCGSERTFEFQVMPQLLNLLKVDSVHEPSIDWGTLAIFTCKRGCNEGNPYHKEVIFKQSFVRSTDYKTEKVEK